MKKGQATVFIIIAIVIVAAIGSVTYITTQNKKIAASNEYFSQTSIRPTLNAIESEIINCAENTAKNALYVIGTQGGYYNREGIIKELEVTFLPYYYYEGDILLPTKENIQDELALYIDNNLNDCVEKIDHPDYSIKHTTTKTQTSIIDNEVTFNINQDSIIEREGNTITFTLSDKPILINSKLNQIYEVAKLFTESHEQDAELYCVSCVSDLAKEHNLFVNIISLEGDETMVRISEIGDSDYPYSLNFVNKYTGDESSPINNIRTLAPNPKVEAQ